MASPMDRITRWLPVAIRRRVEPILELGAVLQQVRSPATVASMLPSIARGFVLRQGRKERPTLMVSGHAACFDWGYTRSFPEMDQLYRRAKQSQWDADVALDWSTDVDPVSPERPLLPVNFFPVDELPGHIRLTELQQREFCHSVAAWMLSQFLHGEQGALLAVAQVTESVPWLEGKLYGATQVMDEGRHVETFHRYLQTKLHKLYVVNDNLFTIIDALMTDSRWDMKFLGMQIMIEGLALGAFGLLYRLTREPLLRDLLRYIIQDEARHVHYGVLALREYYSNQLQGESFRKPGAGPNGCHAGSSGHGQPSAVDGQRGHGKHLNCQLLQARFLSGGKRFFTNLHEDGQFPC